MDRNFLILGNLQAIFPRKLLCTLPVRSPAHAVLCRICLLLRIRGVHSAYASLQGLKLVLLTLGGFPDRRLRAPHDLLGLRGGSGIERLLAEVTGQVRSGLAHPARCEEDNKQFVVKLRTSPPAVLVCATLCNPGRRGERTQPYNKLLLVRLATRGVGQPKGT